jgi:hypothetical protein
MADELTRMSLSCLRRRLTGASSAVSGGLIPVTGPTKVLLDGTVSVSACKRMT